MQFLNTEIATNFWEQQATVVAQEVELFNLSIRDNLTLGQAIPDARLLELLKAVELESWLDQLVDGLDTMVGEKGVTLSAGQKHGKTVVIVAHRPALQSLATSHYEMRDHRLVKR